MDSENEQERDRAQGAETALTEQPDPTTGFGQAAASLPEAVAPRDPQKEIVAALAGERYRDALALCASHHGEALGRLCMALVGSRIEAGDLVQETLLAAYEGFRGYRDEGTVKAWLSSIARRKCARHLEMRSRAVQNPTVGLETEAAVSTEEAVVKRRRAARARSLLESIRPSDREALVLRYCAGLSFREVAQACGIDEAAARKRASRALIKLRSRLGAEE